MKIKAAPLLCELHAHTTWSDGRFSLRALTDLYGRNGFDVLAVTDHAPRAQGAIHALNYDAYLAAIEEEADRAWDLYRLLLVPGLELTYDDPDPGEAAHAVALGLRAYVDVGAGVEPMLRAARAHGAAVIAAHPSELADRSAMKLADRKELGEQLSGFVYGTIVVLSVIVTGAKAFPNELGHIAVLVAVTTIVFWLAHVYADSLAFSIGQDTHLSLAEFGHIARREASLLAAGLPPEAALVLGGFGLFSEHFAVWLSFGLGLTVLGVAGIVFARVERLGPVRGSMAVLANLSLGIVLIGLKVLVVH